MSDTLDSNKAEETTVQEPINEVINKTNFTMTDSYTSAIAADVDIDFVVMPTSTDKEIEKVVVNAADKKIANTNEGAIWVNTVSGGSEFSLREESLLEAAHRDESHWVQKLATSTGANLGPGKANFKNNKKYSGEAQKVRLLSLLGLGTVVSIPLWHSGFWLHLKTPTEAALLEFYRQVTNDKIRLGRDKHGLLFSNTSSYTSKAMMDLIVSNIYQTSLKLPDNANIRDYISTQDLTTCIWGMSWATWPKGFKYSRACVSDIDECKHVITERLDISKLLWVDKSSLTEWQTKHMSSPQPDSMSVDSVKNYKDAFVRGADRLVKLSDQITVTLKTPTVNEHIDAGYKWVNGIENRYIQAMTESENEREEYLVKQAQATAMRQYTHFVKSITTDDGGNTEEHTDQDTIEFVLDSTSTSDKLRNLFVEETAKFINDSTISMVAIPTYKCPRCNKEQSPGKDKGLFSSLLPLDPTQTFFIPLSQKLQRIEIR